MGMFTLPPVTTEKGADPPSLDDYVVSANQTTPKHVFSWSEAVDPMGKQKIKCEICALPWL